MYDPKKLVKREFKFDPTVDRRAVDPFGFFDLRDAYRNGNVPGDVAIEDERFNGVQDPSAVMDRPKDQFEAMRQAEYVKESLQAAQANAEAGHPGGESK